jgi:phosphonate transport system substrate-binding protein
MLLAMLLSTSFNAAAAEPKKQYIMGSFPFMPVSNIEGLFGPVATEIGAKLAKPVVLVSSGSYEKFSEEVKQKKFEIAFVHPFDYVKVAKTAGYLPLASRADKLSSNIVVMESSPIKTIKQIKGKKFGMPPEDSTAALLNKVVLQAEGFNPDLDVTISYYKSHMACLQQLVIGNVDVCGVSQAVIRLAEEQLKAKFKVIHKSPIIPSPLFVVRKDLPQNERDLIKAVLTSTTLESVPADLRRSFYPEGQQKPFIPVTDKDYDAVRTLLKRLPKK